MSFSNIITQHIKGRFEKEVLMIEEHVSTSLHDEFFLSNVYWVSKINPLTP